MKQTRKVNLIPIRLLMLCLITLFTVNLEYAEKINTNFEQKDGTRYKIAGICFSTVGGACLISSVPFFIKAGHEANERNGIGAGFLSTIGGCFLIGGLVFEGVSIPLYIKCSKFNRPTNITFNVDLTSINMFYDF